MALGSLVSKALVRSPMLIIQEHMQLMALIVEDVVLFIAAAQEADWDKAAAIQEQIAAREADGDKIRQQLRRQMSNRLLMPFSRSDLLNLIATQHKIANLAKDIAGLMLGRTMSFPQKLDKQVNNFAAIALQSTQASLGAIDSVHDLFRSGFASREAREVDRKIAEIERLERRSDKAQSKLRARLYKLEKALNPVDAMFLYQVIVWLGDISDRGETLAHKLSLISKP